MNELGLPVVRLRSGRQRGGSDFTLASGVFEMGDFQVVENRCVFQGERAPPRISKNGFPPLSQKK